MTRQLHSIPISITVDRGWAVFAITVVTDLVEQLRERCANENDDEAIRDLDLVAIVLAGLKESAFVTKE